MLGVPIPTAVMLGKTYFENYKYDAWNLKCTNSLKVIILKQVFFTLNFSLNKFIYMYIQTLGGQT